MLHYQLQHEDNGQHRFTKHSSLIAGLV